jgi:hypothetical protein
MLPTSEISIKGGPSGMSADLVPGRIRLEEPRSGAYNAPSDPSPADLLGNGEFGPSWSSAIGGGLGNRGDGDACGDIVAILMSVAMRKGDAPRSKSMDAQKGLGGSLLIESVK